MSSQFLPAARAMVRAWTHVYTAGLPPHVRDVRRAEIDSDLWELETDALARGGLDPAVHVLARCLIGIPDDLSWRMKEARVHASTRAAAAVAVVAALLAAAWLVALLERTAVPPVPIGAAPLQWRAPVDVPPPPPPPPPPPCAQWNPRTGCSR